MEQKRYRIREMSLHKHSLSSLSTLVPQKPQPSSMSTSSRSTATTAHPKPQNSYSDQPGSILASMSLLTDQTITPVAHQTVNCDEVPPLASPVSLASLASRRDSQAGQVRRHRKEDVARSKQAKVAGQDRDSGGVSRASIIQDMLEQRLSSLKAKHYTIGL